MQVWSINPMAQVSTSQGGSGSGGGHRHPGGHRVRLVCRTDRDQPCLRNSASKALKGPQEPSNLDGDGFVGLDVRFGIDLAQQPLKPNCDALMASFCHRVWQRRSDLTQRDAHDFEAGADGVHEHDSTGSSAARGTPLFEDFLGAPIGGSSGSTPGPRRDGLRVSPQAPMCQLRFLLGLDVLPASFRWQLVTVAAEHPCQTVPKLRQPHVGVPNMDLAHLASIAIGFGATGHRILPGGDVSESLFRYPPKRLPQLGGIDSINSDLELNFFVIEQRQRVPIVHADDAPVNDHDLGFRGDRQASQECHRCAVDMVTKPSQPLSVRRLHRFS